jgi:hypothetical protein
MRNQGRDPGEEPFGFFSFSGFLRTIRARIEGRLAPPFSSSQSFGHSDVEELLRNFSSPHDLIGNPNVEEPCGFFSSS